MLERSRRYNVTKMCQRLDGKIWMASTTGIR